MISLAGPRPDAEDPELAAIRGQALDPQTLDRGPGTLDLLRPEAEVPELAPARVQPEKAAPKFVTSLKLTPEQEEALVDRALTRINEVKREMGLDVSGYVEPGSWMAIRQRNQDSYDNDYSWRLTLGGIFAKSNFSLGTNTRHARYLSARVQDDLMGTSPFFAALGKGKNADKARLARQVEEFVVGEVESSQVPDGIRESQKVALVINEAVVKTVRKTDTSPFNGPARVYVNGFGEPLLTPEKQLYVLEDDNMLPHPAVQDLFILEKDPSFIMAKGQYRIQYFPDLAQNLTLYDNVHSESLDYRCFLCPLRVASTHDADINVHLYKKSPDKLREIYSGIDVSDNYFHWWDLTGDKQPKLIHGETAEYTSAILQEVTVAEVYLRFDADGDGRSEEIMLILDMQNQRPIFYDYLANHFDERPFAVIPGLEKVMNRWYGRGIYSLGEDQELHIDAEFNRAQVKGSRSSVVTFRHTNAVEEWKNGLPTVIGGGDIYNLSNGDWGPDKNPPIFNVNLAEGNDQALELMEISRQASDAVIGAISVADASQSDMNQSKTATGIINLQASSDVITKATESTQTKGIEAVLRQVVACLLRGMDKTKLLLNKDATELVVLNRDEIRALSRDVRLLLTRSRSTQLLNSSEKALTIVKDYRATMLQDPQAAMIQRPLYILLLKGLEVAEADELLPEITQEQVDAFNLAQQQAQLQEQQNAQLEHSAKLAKLNGNPSATHPIQPA